VGSGRAAFVAVAHALSPRKYVAVGSALGFAHELKSKVSIVSANAVTTPGRDLAPSGERLKLSASTAMSIIAAARRKVLNDERGFLRKPLPGWKLVVL
jgi:hypothetical protein